jgi:membrane-bound lytic murein transglycosylase B
MCADYGEVVGLVHGVLAAAAVAMPLPDSPRGYAEAFADVRPAQRALARAWDGRRPVPKDLAAHALYEQRLAFALADSKRLRRRAIPLIPRRERAGVRDEVRAQVKLSRLARGWPVKPAREYNTGRAESARTLWRYYGKAKRRFGVSRALLGAVNLVESSFNRLRSDSVAGAQGPMQFIPSTWEAYGMGGDVHDPRDAILGAANYLHANGAPRDNARALYHYNPSLLYVDAVRRYARHMRSFTGFRFYYARSLFVRAKGGGHRRLTGP